MMHFVKSNKGDTYMNAEPEGAHAGNVKYLPSAGAQNMVQLYKTLERPHPEN